MVLQSLVHPTRTLDELNKQRNFGIFTDINILVFDQKFPAHRALLAAHSPVFRSVLEGSSLSFDNTPNINLDGVETSYFEILLDFIYTSKLSVTMGNVDQVKATASFLQVSSVVDLCEKFTEANRKLDSSSIMTVTENKSLDSEKASNITIVKPSDQYHQQENFESRPTTLDEKIEVEVTQCDFPIEIDMEELEHNEESTAEEEALPTEENRTDQHVQRFRCPICNKQLTKQRLKNHIKMHSTNDKPTQCRVCGSTFANVYNLRIHERSHTGERPFKCKICDKTFSDPSTLSKHKLWHAGIKRKKCSVCERSFMTTAQVREHMKTHTKERPFKCQHCDRTFAYKCDLNCHLREHTGNLFGPCEHCGRYFNHRGNFKVHLRNHEKKLAQGTSRSSKFSDNSVIKMNDLAHLVSQGHSIAVMVDGNILVKPQDINETGVDAAHQPLIMSPEEEIVSATVSLQKSMSHGLMTGHSDILTAECDDQLTIADHTMEQHL